MKLYHWIMMHYYSWRKHLACNKVRKFLKSQGDNTEYTDDAIVYVCSAMNIADKYYPMLSSKQKEKVTYKQFVERLIEENLQLSNAEFINENSQPSSEDSNTTRPESGK